MNREPLPRQVLLDAHAIAAGVNRPYSTVRAWVARGHLKVMGKDYKGRKLYDLETAHQIARRNPPRR